MHIINASINSIYLFERRRKTVQRHDDVGLPSLPLKSMSEGIMPPMHPGEPHLFGNLNLHLYASALSEAVTLKIFHKKLTTILKL